MAFITDVFSRYIVGWQVSTTLRAELALDALEMAIWAQRPSLCRTSGRGADRLVCRIRRTETRYLAGSSARVDGWRVQPPRPKRASGVAPESFAQRLDVERAVKQ